MMNLFDRYSSMPILEKDLPGSFDFGRFIIKGAIPKPLDLTYSNFATNKVICQDILLSKNKSLQDVFIEILTKVEASKDCSFAVIPLVQRVRSKLGLNEFELMLMENVFHLEEIFRQPHYLLEREIEKVHVSRAKRIPSKSYQYLASHTEDWIHKSIVSFKPIRILNEELDLNYDIYENHLIIAFLERCLVYLNSRLKEIQDIKTFLQEYKKLLQNREDDKGWYKKIVRNLKLIGAVYEDEYYIGRSQDGTTLSQTEEVLNQINKRLLSLRKSELFDEVNKRSCQTIELRNTNVLINHKHYRYVKNMWIELDKIKPEKSDNEKLQFEQNVIYGLRAYAITLISYCLSEYLEYKLSGNYYSFVAEHLFYPKIKMKVDDDGLLHLTIGLKALTFIVIANEPTDPEILSGILEKHDSYVLFFTERSQLNGNRLVHISPLDPDSCERVTALIMQYVLKQYLENIHMAYRFPSNLRDYIHLVPDENIRFDTVKFEYSFKSPLLETIKSADIQIALENTDKFKSVKSRMEKERIASEMLGLTSQINSNAQTLKKDHLYCIFCCNPLNVRTVVELDYLLCQRCNYLLDSSHKDIVILKNIEAKYELLSNDEWGMDYLNFDPEVL